MFKTIGFILIAVLLQACTIKINCKEIGNMNFNDGGEEVIEEAVSYKGA